ncbi:MAG TPA: ATP synthase F1 subunit epsilon [Thermoanaerobaculia bacterium]|nr:ATP synthase F1 subunit epsilon [Thermoanaerobaculia bacterium]
MAKGDTFHVSVITPERAVLEADATFVAFPAHDGEVGILPGRAPLLFKMGIGLLRVEKPAADGGEERFFVDGGFAQMVENRLTLLTEQAKRLSEIDRAAAQRAFAAAHELPADTEAAFAARQRALDRARIQLHLTGGASV